MGRVLMRYPLLTVVLLELVYDALIIAGSLGLSALVPDLPGDSVREPSQSLVLVLGSAAVLLALIGALGWWRLAGSLRPRAGGTYGCTGASPLLAAPFVAGVRPLALDAIGLLLVAYMATAVFEEGLWRGVMIGLLRPSGVWRAVLISSLLFGLGHLGNSALRGLSPIIAAQAFGAGVQGVGFAALRLRTNTIWPLIVIHTLHDVSLADGHAADPAHRGADRHGHADLRNHPAATGSPRSGPWSTAAVPGPRPRPIQPRP